MEKISKPKKCEFIRLTNGKLYCITHNQTLIYAYDTKEGLRLHCQVGEDESISYQNRIKK